MNEYVTHCAKPAGFAGGLCRLKLVPATWQSEAGGCSVELRAPMAEERQSCMVVDDVLSQT